MVVLLNVDPINHTVNKMSGNNEKDHALYQSVSRLLSFQTKKSKENSPAGCACSSTFPKAVDDRDTETVSKQSGGLTKCCPTSK